MHLGKKGRRGISKRGIKEKREVRKKRMVPTAGKMQLAAFATVSL